MYSVATTSLGKRSGRSDEIQYMHSVYMVGDGHDLCTGCGALFQEVRSRWELARRADPSPECGMLSLSALLDRISLYQVLPILLCLPP